MFLSTTEKEISGGLAQFVGEMEYLLVASPTFLKKYFSSKNPFKCLLNAPAIKFDQNDNLHERYLEKYFGIDGRDLKYNMIPSVKGFKQFAIQGYGYALIPKIDIVKELKNKHLIPIYPSKTWKILLYWHYWAVQSKFYQKFNNNMVRLIKEKLIIGKS